MEQLVKFISDSISDMTCRGGVSYEQSTATAPFFAMDRKTSEGDNPWIENSNEPRLAVEEESDDLNDRCVLNDAELLGSFSNAGEPEEWSVSRQRCSITPPVFVDGCKFPESCETSQDVVQQSHVSSSKSPSVLANDIIGPLLLEALDGFLFMVDKRNEIQFISENVTQYLKYTKEDLIGNSIFNLIHDEDHKFFTQALDVLKFDASCKSPSFTCRMLIKQPGKGQPVYDKMQITTTIQSYPFESKSNPGSQLVACVARRIGVPKPNMPSTEIEQFTTKQDVKGVILDTCGLNPDNFGFSNLIGQNIQNFCHVNDKPQLFKHHREVLSSGTNTSGVYRFKLKEDKYVFVQTKSQLFKNPANPKLDFVMSTHSIVKECCDDNELKGTASSSLVKVIIGQTGNKSKIRQQQSNEDTFGDFQSISCSRGYQYHDTDVGDDGVKGMHPRYWRGGRGHQGCGSVGGDRPTLPIKSRGRGDRLTTRPVGRPRLHPGGFASSRLHSQMSKSSEVKQDSFKRDGCPPAVWSNPRRRRRQHHLPRSNSMTMGCDNDIFSPCSLNKHITGAMATNSIENITGFNPKNNFIADVGNFGSQQHRLQKELGQEMSASMDNFPDMNNSSDFLPASEQSFLDELLAETSEIGNSFLSDDFCMDFDESILDEVAKQNPTSNFSQSSFNFTPVDNFSKPMNILQQNFNKPLSFAPPLNDVRSSGTPTFKQTDFRGTLADDRTHLTDLLVDRKVGDQSRKEVWSHKISDKKKDKGGSNSNIILKKLLSQEDEENEDDDDSQANGSHESGGRVLALLTQGTAIGEVFPGGICKQLKKELENNSANNNIMNGNNNNNSNIINGNNNNNIMNGNNNNNNNIMNGNNNNNIMNGNNNNNKARSTEESVRSLPSLMTACEDPKKLYHLGDKINVSVGALGLLEEVLSSNNPVSENVAYKERQNVLLKELLNEKSNLSTPSVQSKLLKSLLASDEANFGALEEKCSLENNVGLLPIVERNSGNRFFPDARNFDGSGNTGIDVNDDFLSSSFTLDFDCMTNCDRDPPNEEDPPRKVDATLDSPNPGDLSRAPIVGLDASSSSMSLGGRTTSKSDLVHSEKSKEESNVAGVYQSTGGKTFFDNSSSSFASTHHADKKLFNNSYNSASNSLTGQESQSITLALDPALSSDSSMFSFPQDLEQSKSKNAATGTRPSRKNILLAQLLSRTSDDGTSSGAPPAVSATAPSSTIFPTRNASSIAVVTPMVHMLKQNKKCSSPSQTATCGKDPTEESKEKMEFASKKVKVDDPFEKIQSRAKPSASLQPFRCRPTHGRQQNACRSSSPVPSFSSPSTSIFSPLSSSPSTSAEFFTPKTQLLCSGGTMEHANGNKFSGDGAPVGIVPRFDSSGPTTETTRCNGVKIPDARQVLLQQSNKPSDLNILEDKPPWVGNSQQVSSNLEPLPMLHDGDGYANDNFSVSGKTGLDLLSAQRSSNNIIDALVKNNGQSSNVCSTRPFIAQPPLTSSSTLPVSLPNDEDPFSATYSPISPALQDENSQEVLSSNVTANFLQGTVSDDVVDAGNDVVKTASRNLSENRNSICMPQTINIQQMTASDSCRKVQCAEENNSFGFAYPGVQVQSNFSNPGCDWNDGVDSKSHMLMKQHEKHGTIISGEGHISNQERISRKRLHSDMFALDQSTVDPMPWHVNDHLARGNPPPFDGVNQQQQMMFQKHQMLGDSKRHLGMHPEFMGNQVHPTFQGQGQGMIFGKMHSQMRFNAVQETYPSYQMERGWGQTRWTHAMGGTRHKPPYSPGDYQSLSHDRPCYVGPQMTDKVAVGGNAKQPRQYFHSQMHLQQPSQPFIGHQRPNLIPSFTPQYVKHKVGPNFPPEYLSCCNVSNCPVDLPGRPGTYEIGNYIGHLRPPNHHLHQQHQQQLQQQQQQQQQQQSMFHQQQLHHLANQQQHQFVQQAPQHFRSESYEGMGRKLHHNNSRPFDVVQQSIQMQQQPQISAPNSDQSASFCNSSYPADQKSLSSSMIDDSLRIHPDSGLLDFTAEEVSGQLAGRRTSDSRDGVGPSKGRRPDPAAFDETSNCPAYTERYVAWGNDRTMNNLQFNSFNNSLNNSINSSGTDGDISLTKEYLRKELRNICTARSQQQSKTDVFDDDFENGNPSRGSSLGTNGGSSTDPPSFDARVARLQNPIGNVDKTEKKTQETDASDGTGRDGSHEVEDIFKSISFADVESDAFWSNLSPGDENKMTFDCDDLF